jgi:hypothetical protein
MGNNQLEDRNKHKESIIKTNFMEMGDAVAELVEALCYKLEGRGFESRLGGFFN